jgi:hypothetical protein
MIMHKEKFGFPHKDLSRWIFLPWETLFHLILVHGCIQMGFLSSGVVGIHPFEIKKKIFTFVPFEIPLITIMENFEVLTF